MELKDGALFAVHDTVMIFRRQPITGIVYLINLGWYHGNEYYVFKKGNYGSNDSRATFPTVESMFKAILNDATEIRKWD
jgi:hypothetical protein